MCLHHSFYMDFQCFFASDYILNNIIDLKVTNVCFFLFQHVH